MSLRPWLLSAAAAALVACGTPEAKKTGSSSGSSGSTTSAGSGSSGGSGSTGAGSTGSASASGSSGSSGTSGSHGSSGGTTGTHSSSSSTGGACFPDNTFVGAGNGAQCCSGVESGGYCAVAGGTTGGAGSSGGSGSTGSDICTTQRCVVYAQTAQDLYQIDPANPNNATHLCSFSGLGGADVYDIAVRADGALFALTPTALYQVNATTCQGTLLANVPSASGNFNGLSFTAGGLLLAADTFGQVNSIDTSTGATQVVGNYGGSYSSSGDIVTLSNGTIYATAIDLTGASSTDVLVTLDPANSYHATPIGSIGYSHIYGLAYWAGNLYGFDEGGDVLQIDPSTAQASALAGAHSGLPWYGAGTTPLAPIVNR